MLNDKTLLLTQRVSNFLRAVEYKYIFKESTPSKVYFCKPLLFPIRAIQDGISHFTKSLTIWAVVMFILMLVLLVPDTAIHREHKDSAPVIFNLCAVIVLYFVLFVSPSFYNPNKYSIKMIAETIKLLNNEKIKNIKGLDLFSREVEIRYEQIFARVKKFKWLVALIWGLLLYLLSIFFNLVMESKVEIASDISIWIIATSIGLFFASLCVFGYEAFLKRMHSISQHAFNEVSFQIENL